MFVSRANLVRHKKQSKVSTDMKAGWLQYKNIFISNVNLVCRDNGQTQQSEEIFLHFALFLAIMTHGFEINVVKKVSITIKSQSLHVCAL